MQIKYDIGDKVVIEFKSWQQRRAQQNALLSNDLHNQPGIIIGPEEGPTCTFNEYTHRVKFADGHSYFVPTICLRPDECIVEALEYLYNKRVRLISPNANKFTYLAASGIIVKNNITLEARLGDLLLWAREKIQDKAHDIVVAANSLDKDVLAYVFEDYYIISITEDINV